MTGDPSWAVQQAIFDALTGAAALTALLGDGAAGVYDDVPENATFPYVTIGETFLSPFDTKTEIGVEHVVVLHIWSRYEGAKECKQIMTAIYDALNRAALSVSGQTVVDSRFTFAQTMRDPDGETRHGIQRFTVWTVEA